MIRPIGSLLTICMVAIIISCASDGKQQHLQTDRGYDYVMHTDVDGPVALPGEYTIFTISMRAGDSLLNTSSGMPDLPRLQIPEAGASGGNTAPIIDGLRLMSVGDSMTLFFPLDSMDAVPPAFADIEMIEYDLGLKEIKTAEEFQAEMEAHSKVREAELAEVRERLTEVTDLSERFLKDYNENNLDLKETPEGIKYIIHQEGTGAKPTQGKMVSVQYFGRLLDGTIFDTSFRQGEGYAFPIGMGRVIKGWDQGLMHFNEGTRASLFIPSSLAYGEGGNQGIPGNATLYFYVELEKVN